jgi:hypothetical protein
MPCLILASQTDDTVVFLRLPIEGRVIGFEFNTPPVFWFPGIFCLSEQKISGAFAALDLAISAQPRVVKVPDMPVG